MYRIGMTIESNEKKVLLEEYGQTLIMKINNPEKKNIMSQEVRGIIWKILTQYENSNHKTLVITGEGENFSAGADIRNLKSLDSETVREYTSYVREFLNYLKNYPKITLGMVRGFAIGGGLELLLCLDMVYCGKTAKFGQTELNVGIIPGGGATQRLQDTVGIRKAKEMIFTGEIINSDDALKSGLVNNVFNDDELLSETLKIANRINEKSFSSLIYSKLAINFKSSEEIKYLYKESEMYRKILLSEDGKEGLNAFLEKRRPKFSNKIIN